MKQNLYIFSDTLLKRKQNTLFFETVITNDEEFDEKLLYKEEYLNENNNLIPSGVKKYIPVETVDSIFAIGTINFNSRFLYFLTQNNIPLHFFSIKGNYAGSFFPSNCNISGNVLTKQVEYYSNFEKRLFLAKKIVQGSLKAILSNLKYYLYSGAYLSEHIDKIEEIEHHISIAESVNEIMGYEGEVRKTYYNGWQHIFSYPVDFSRRIKKPPNNMINSLISYGNTILYGSILNEIRNTKIYPEVGFVHEIGSSKLPLVYDLADIFKPLIIDINQTLNNRY